MNRRMVVYK